jgi:hypothetical protein
MLEMQGKEVPTLMLLVQTSLSRFRSHICARMGFWNEKSNSRISNKETNITHTTLINFQKHIPRSVLTLCGRRRGTVPEMDGCRELPSDMLIIACFATRRARVITNGPRQLKSNVILITSRMIIGCESNSLIEMDK